MTAQPARPHRWPRPRALLAAVAAAGLAAAAAPAPAQSAPDPSCPPAYTDRTPRRMAVTGLTVASGTTPRSFDGKVLGVIDDGIAPGMDMIMVELSSPAIDANGIWAGMSGSPVYAADGRLIGAVAYGLSWSPSPVAGVTPATHMRELLTQPAAARLPGATRVAIPDRLSDRLVQRGDLTRGQADSGLRRLPIPLGISNLSQERLNKVARRLDIKGVRVIAAGSTSATAPVTPIVPGGNLAASLSYGDITAAGVGTATAVCGEEVLAFGHPMLWTGESQLTMHGARAVYVQRDDVFGSFKVANPTGPVGGIVQDRRAAILGRLGLEPATTQVTSYTESGDRSRRGRTQISVEAYLAYLSVFHLLVNEDRVFDQLGPGTSRIGMVVEGVRADGSPFSYRRTNRYASEWDITYEPLWDLYRQIQRIVENRFEEVRVTHVGFDAQVDDQLDGWRVRGLQIRRGGEWLGLEHRSGLKLQPRQTVHLRAVLAPRDNGPLRYVRSDLVVPGGSARSSGVIDVSNGFGRREQKPKSFEDLLAMMRAAPQNNEVATTLYLEKDREGPDREWLRDKTTSLAEVVGGQFHTHVKVARR